MQQKTIRKKQTQKKKQQNKENTESKKKQTEKIRELMLPVSFAIMMRKV